MLKEEKRISKESRKTVVPISFNESYRRYVSEKIIKEKSIVRDFSKSKLPKMYNIIYPVDYYDSIVTNSHQHPREGIHFIKPYSNNKLYKSDFIKNFINEPVFAGSKRYTRGNMPNRMQPLWT
jgi:hypothetical protein